MGYYNITKLEEGVYRITSREAVFMDLFVGTEKALLFDTGWGLGPLKETIREITDLPLILVNSHGHVDHVCGNLQFAEPAYINETDIPLAKLHGSRMMREYILAGDKDGSFVPEGFDKEAYLSQEEKEYIPVEEGHVFDLGGKTLEVVNLPGHTKGSIGLYYKEGKILYAADAIGRVVTINGDDAADLSTYTATLMKALSLDITRFASGHDPLLHDKAELAQYLHVAQNADWDTAISYKDPGNPDAEPNDNVRIVCNEGMGLKDYMNPDFIGIVVTKEKMGMKEEKETFEQTAIWGSIIPGNVPGRLKAEVMDVNEEMGKDAMSDLVSWIKTLISPAGEEGKAIMDTYTRLYVWPMDPSYKETFEDVPYLIPFIAEGSDKAVIVVPGGGYCTKEMEGEGTNVAKVLQANGITAFVLWYRTLPYYQPYPLMDLQRAVRYVRHKAKEYGYDENKIGAVGFSAGGAQISLYMNVLQPGIAVIPDYENDEIDKEDDRLNFAGLVYPAVRYAFNGGMIFASLDKESFHDLQKQKAFVETYDAIRHFNSASIPQFVCYGNKDRMVSLPDIHDYVELLKQNNTPYKEVVVDGADHGFGAGIGTPYAYWLDEFVSWLKEQ